MERSSHHASLLGAQQLARSSWADAVLDHSGERAAWSAAAIMVEELQQRSIGSLQLMGYLFLLLDLNR